MKVQISRTALLLIGAYLLLVCAVLALLIRDGYIGHGNALVYFPAIALTSPLSLVLVLLSELFLEVNAFHMTGWPYYLSLSELGLGALFNCWLICKLVTYIQRKSGA